MKTDIQSLIVKYVKGSLDDGEAAFLADWAASSQKNRRAFRRAVAAFSASELSTPRSRAMADRLLKERKRKARILPVRFFYGMAAAGIAAAVALFLFLRVPAGTPSPEAVSQPAPLCWTAEGKMQLTLSDGTRVTLNKGSRLELASDFNRSARRVSLEGEAWFDVAKDSTRLFTIHCGDYDYVVRGTTFNISSWPGDKQSVVTLHTGSLEARVQDAVILLKPGDELRVDNEDASFSKQAVADVEQSVSWVDSDRLFFDRTPIRDVGSKLTRKYGVNIHVQEEIGNIPYTGRTDSESLEEILHILKMTSPVPLAVTFYQGDDYISKI